jgi:hypothetical protein
MLLDPIRRPHHASQHPFHSPVGHDHPLDIIPITVPVILSASIAVIVDFGPAPRPFDMRPSDLLGQRFRKQPSLTHHRTVILPDHACRVGRLIGRVRVGAGRRVVIVRTSKVGVGTANCRCPSRRIRRRPSRGVQSRVGRMMRSLSISVRVGDGRKGGGDGDVGRLKGCRRYHDHSG